METNTKEKILIAASRLFRKQGFHATTLNQITKESNTPRGSVYYYFENGKEQLAQEAILRTGKIIKEYIEVALNKETDIATAIKENFINMGKKMEQQKEETDVFSLVAISREVSATNPLLRKTCEEVYNNWIDVYTKRLEETGFDSNEAHQLAVAIQAWVEGAYALAVSHQSATPMYIVSEQVQYLLDHKSKK